MSLRQVLLLSKKEAKPFIGKPNVLNFNKPIGSNVAINTPQQVRNSTIVNLVTPGTGDTATTYREIGYYFNDRNEKIYFGQRVPKNKTQRALFSDDQINAASHAVIALQRASRNRRAELRRLREGFLQQNERDRQARDAARIRSFNRFTEKARRKIKKKRTDANRFYDSKEKSD